MIGAEFLGMIMLIVYVGAVAVLFLFVVMMLNITEQESKKIRRKGLSKDVLDNLFRGVYTPKRPSNFFVNRLNEIKPDLYISLFKKLIFFISRQTCN